MCFSTARSDNESDEAMAALFLPWAIAERTSDSRTGRSRSGDEACERAATRASMTLGSITEPPRTTSRMAARSWSRSDTRTLSR